MTKVLKHYPRLTTIVLSYVLAAFLLAIIGPEQVQRLVDPLGMGGIVIAGMMYTYSFTASVATFTLPAFVQDYSITVIALLGGTGALIADIVILRFIKKDLNGEITRLTKKIVPHRGLGKFIAKQQWLRIILGFVIIASPLPDELGLVFLASVKIREDSFRVLSFMANAAGIYAVVSVGTLIY